MLFPSGSYFWGFTVTASLTGLIYGLILYRKEFKLDKNFIIRVIISSLIVTVFLNGFLNTVWVIMITKNASKIVVPIRLLKQLIMMPIIAITTIGICKILEERIKND